ncbi:MAG: lysozyme inhibitor LprI family protein [Pseudobdellovibrionaceae bacterium]
MKTVIFSLVLLCSLIARADITKIDSEYSECIDKAESTAAQNDCINTAYNAADKELNKVYNTIKIPLSKSTDANDKEILKRLITSEKAWLTYRDANCSLAGIQMLGGTGEGPLVGGCLVSTTVTRVKELQSLFTTP